MLVLYGTVLGLSKKLANQLEVSLNETHIDGHRVDVRVKNIASYDPEDLEKESGCYVIVIMSTYADGSDPPSATPFCKWIREAQDDFRVGKGFLQDLRGFAVLGLGDSAYPCEDFCSASRRLSSGLASLGAFQLLPDVERDASSAICDKVFRRWFDQLVKAMTQKQPRKLQSNAKVANKQLMQPNGMQKRREKEVVSSNNCCFNESIILSFVLLCILLRQTQT